MSRFLWFTVYIMARWSVLLLKVVQRGGDILLISGLPVMSHDYKGSTVRCQVHGPGEFVAVTQPEGGAFI